MSESDSEFKKLIENLPEGFFNGQNPLENTWISEIIKQHNIAKDATQVIQNATVLVQDATKKRNNILIEQLDSYIGTSMAEHLIKSKPGLIDPIISILEQLSDIEPIL